MTRDVAVDDVSSAEAWSPEWVRRRRRAHQARPRDAETGRLVEPIPLDRSICWKPLPDSYYLLATMIRGPETEYPLFVTQRVLLGIDREVRTREEGHHRIGLLCGDIYRCPESGERYAVVDALRREPDVTQADDGGDADPAEVAARIETALGEYSGTAVGWYRTSPTIRPQLSPADMEVHRAFFSQPWQAAAVVSTANDYSAGVFFVFEQRVSRSYYVEFHELLDRRSHGGVGSAGPTCVTWSTYVTDWVTHPLSPTERELILESPPEPAVVELGPPPDPVLDRIEQALSGIWARARGRVLAPVRDFRLPKWSRWRADFPDGARNAIADDALAPLDEPSPDAASGGQIRAPAAHARWTLPEWELLFGAPAGQPVDERIFLDDPNLPPPDLKKPHAVVLPPGFYDQGDQARKSTKRRRFFVLAAAFLLAGAGTGTWALWQARARTVQSATVPPPSGVVAADSSVGVAAAMPRAEEFVFGGVDVRLDSLSQSLSFYHEVQSDFERKRLGCRVLARAYQLAKLRQATARRTIGDSSSLELDGPRATRYATLRENMRAVDRDFAAARCPPE